MYASLFILCTLICFFKCFMLEYLLNLWGYYENNLFNGRGNKKVSTFNTFFIGDIHEKNIFVNQGMKQIPDVFLLIVLTFDDKNITITSQ